ncbi:MAG: flagellar hook-associated family protein [Rhodomicrobium sp.]
MINSVSTYSLFAAPRNAVVNLQTQLTQAETEQTTGLLADPVQSLGSQIGLDESLRSQASTLANYQSANTIAQTTLSVSQNALSAISSDAQNFVNQLITAQGSGDVSTLQTQAQALLGSLTSDLNTTSAGVYVFGGANSSVAPMADYSGAPQAATAAAFQAAFGFTQSNSQASSVPAASMQSFLSGPFANLFSDPSWSANWSQASGTETAAVISPGESVPTTVSANQSAFSQLASAYTSIADLGINNLNPSAQQAVVTSALDQANAALGGISGMQTTLGISQSQLTNANSQLQTQSTAVNNWVSQLEGVDAYQAATALTDLTTQLETAYGLTNQIAKLGLVNYLSTA